MRRASAQRPRSMPRSEPPSHDAGLACPQLSAAATDDDVGRLATTMLDRLARPPLGQGTATFSSPDVDLTQSAFEGRPRHIATVGQPRLPRQGSLLKSCSRTLSRGCDRVFKNLGYSLRGSDTSAEQARPDSAGAGPNPSCCQARPSWQVGLARIATPGGEGGWRAPSLTHVVPRRAASGASPRSRRSEGSNSSQRRPRPVLQPPMNP